MVQGLSSFFYRSEWREASRRGCLRLRRRPLVEERVDHFHQNVDITSRGLQIHMGETVDDEQIRAVGGDGIRECNALGVGNDSVAAPVKEQ